MTPLVPACVDLRDFPFMPMEFGRLFASDTWTLSNDAEKVAAITLWGKSWAQVPAGSLPDDDRLLAAHSGAGPRWKRVKDMALRGWRKCDDGRLYHPVVCAKALEAWLEKLSSRLSSGAGNAKRWGIEFDPSEIEAQINDARRMLAALNPQSRTLTKKKPPGVPLGSKKPPVGNAEGIPPGVPLGSQETGTGTGNIRSKERNPTGYESAQAADAPPPVAENGAESGLVLDGQPPCVAPVAKPQAKRCPFTEIVKLYHEALPMCPRVEKLTDARKGYLRQRWLDDLPSLDAWRNYFTDVATSKFLTGKAEGHNGKPPFVADLEWLSRPGNFAKVAEGKYHR